MPHFHPNNAGDTMADNLLPPYRPQGCLPPWARGIVISDRLLAASVAGLDERGGARGVGQADKTPPGGVGSHTALSTPITRSVVVPSKTERYARVEYDRMVTPKGLGVPVALLPECERVSVTVTGWPCAGGCGALGECHSWMCSECWGEPQTDGGGI